MHETRIIIANYLNELLADEDISHRFEPDSPLVDDGLLDSINLVRLIQFVEEHFELVIPEHDIDEVLFATIPSIAEYIDRNKGS